MPESQVAKQFMLDVGSMPELVERYNIAPRQKVLTVLDRADAGGHVAERMSWGLVPSWTKDLAEARRPINAKAETVDTLPSFKNALRRRRCILPATGFYEWKDTGAKQKQPMFFHMNDASLFGFAGIWEYWKDRESGEELVSCALITTTPNAVVAPVHDRMPAILPAEHYDLWLDPGIADVDALKAMLGPYPAELMEAYPVATLVNKVGNDGPALIEHVIPTTDGLEGNSTRVGGARVTRA